MSRKRKKRRVPKDKRTGLPKKYLTGLKGAKRTPKSNTVLIKFFIL